MKIAFIGNLPAAGVLPENTIREEDRGGNHPAPWIAALLPEMARLGGHELRVMLAQHAVLRHTIMTRDGVEYEGIPSWAPERLFRSSGYWSKTLPLRRALRRYKPDLVHAFGMETGAATIALRSGYPVSCFIQGIAELCFPFNPAMPRLDRALGLALERWAVARTRWLVAETEFARKWAAGINPGARIEVIPHPLRTVFLEQAEPTYEANFIAVGALTNLKGTEVVIKAFAAAALPDSKLWLVGSGPLREAMQALATDSGVGRQVEFTGSLETPAVIERMLSCRALVIASRMDTSPNVISEAHALGLPVIGTRAGGIPEMIADGVDGWLTEIDDVTAIADRMWQIAQSAEMARRLGQAGRLKVSQLNSAAAVAAQHLRFFAEIREQLNDAKKV